MMKKKFTGAAALGLCLALGISMGASADSRKVVTLGADLTDQQKQIVMNYFGVTSDQVDILTITNQDERDHLGSHVLWSRSEPTHTAVHWFLRHLPAESR